MKLYRKLIAPPAFCLALAMVEPGYSQTINDISGSSSPTDATSSPFFELVLFSVTAYDGVFTVFPAPFTGPLNGVGYYTAGASPCDVANGGIIGCGIPPMPGDGKIRPTLSGTVTIDDKGTPCDADDTIAASYSYSSATRVFQGGPGVIGQETWANGDLTYTLAETTVDSANPNGNGGCDYEIASSGFPSVITANGGANVFADDLDIGIGPGQIQYDAPSLVGVATFEFFSNIGAFVSVANGPSYSCLTNIGPCTAGQQHHSTALGGLRGNGLENTLWSVSTDGNGNITAGTIFPVNEAMIAALPSWNSPLHTFTGACANCLTEIEIDIKPNTDETNPIAPNARGVIPVAILTTADFDALTVDPTTLAFGPNAAAIVHSQGHPEDVNGDGDIDLLVHFRTQDTGIACGDTEVTLTGELFDGQPVEGTDTITTVGRGCD